MENKAEVGQKDDWDSRGARAVASKFAKLSLTPRL
jgi:hypothetical protein